MKASNNTPNETDKRFWHKNTEHNNSEMLIIENAKNGINRSTLFAKKKEKCKKAEVNKQQSAPNTVAGGKSRRKNWYRGFDMKQKEKINTK